MQLVIGSKNLNSETVVALDSSGREYLVVVTKATWSIPQSGKRPRPLPPEALEDSDVFVGDAGVSSMLYGSDFARFKPKCDILFNAHAYAPNGEPVRELVAGWQMVF